MFIFSFRSSKFSRLYHHEAPSKSSQGFTLCSQLLFLCYHPLILLPEFSRRLNMVVRQGFFSFFNCSSRFLLKLLSVKLYSKINMVLNTCFCFGGAQVFFILHSKVQFFLPYLLRWCYVTLDNSLAFHVSHVVKNEIF